MSVRPGKPCRNFLVPQAFALTMTVEQAEPWRLCYACGHPKAAHESQVVETDESMLDWLNNKIVEQRDQIDKHRDTKGGHMLREYHRGALEALTHVQTRLVDGL